MAILKTAEDKLGDMYKGVPPLSASAKESLAKAWPWLALIFGILQLAAAYWLWQLTRVVNTLNDFVNSVSVYYTGKSAGLSAMDKTVIYLGVVLLVVDAAILLMAYPELVKRTKRGWDLIFLGSLLNLAYAVVTIFINGRGVGSFLSSLIGSAIAFYLLFQVREKYTGNSAK
jgi:hypothetical protein